MGGGGGARRKRRGEGKVGGGKESARVERWEFGEGFYVFNIIRGTHKIKHEG